MNAKIIILILTILILSIMVYTNPSYEKSIQAKYYYEMGEYKSAYKLAKESFALDSYNRMAATIMAGSKTALKYVNYINDAKKYIRNIGEIATHDDISDADKAKIKLVCEIMIDSYVKLAPSVVTDEELVVNS